MQILRLVRLAILSLLLLIGLGLAAYLGLGAYRDDLAEVLVRYFRLLGPEQPERYSLKIGDGFSVEDPGALALKLKEVARLDPFRVDLDIVTAADSADALAQVAAGTIDVAFVHGGLRPPAGATAVHVEQAAALGSIPLQFLIADSLADENLRNLKNERVWMDSAGSGTRDLATKALELAEPGLAGQVIADDRPLASLRRCKASDLPRALFLTAPLPSSFAEELINQGGYRLQPLAMASALALRHYGVQKVEIPEYTYGMRAGVAVDPVATIGSRVLLVVGGDRAAARPADLRRKHRAVASLLAAIFEGDFARGANLPDLVEAELDRNPEFPIYPATRTFRNRHESVFTGENIQALEALANLALGALVLLVFPGRVLVLLLGRWRFDAALREAERIRSAIARAVADGPGARPPDRRPALARRLGELQGRVARDYANGRMPKREQFDRLSTYIENLRVALVESPAG